MRVLAAFLALPLFATPAAAQDWNNLAASEAMNQVHATMRQHMIVNPAEEGENGARGTPPAPARMDATYRVDPNVRRTVQQKLVAAVTRQNEAAGEELSATFARHDLIAMGDRALSSFGLRSGDVIDAVTIYRLAMWGAAKGLTTPPPRSAITGARMQTASTFDLAAARLDTPARRQEFAETLLYQAILMDLASEQAQKSRDQVTIDALGRSARQALVASGLNPDRMQLTSRGFILER
ncbi:DUF6683 family protein [Sphingobium scionense]|nr:DUF6683 family protein [Sphingobium scionense]AGH51458.1 hypothetical protein G432_18700 [Sphingomonas sp. MM-1]MBB4150140.1 hypothetical protein [Sphingobium scionense]TNE42747.1 MAG: hypothetical protein EP345_05990 [Sphingomonadales bacterium]